MTYIYRKRSICYLKGNAGCNKIYPKNRQFILLIFIMILSGLCFARESINQSADSYFNDQKNRLRFKTINNPDLDSIGELFSVVQDPQGFIWFGGHFGLARYDGTAVKPYLHNPKITDSLSNNNVKDLLVDSKGRLWIATYGGGLNLYNPANDNFILFAHEPQNAQSLSHNTVTSLFERQDGHLWVATSGGGLNLFNPDTHHFTSYQNRTNDTASFISDNLTVVIEDQYGMVWIGSADQGLIRFDSKNQFAKRFQHNPLDSGSLSHNTVLAIHEDQKHQIWIGTDGGGLNLFDENTERFIRYTNDPGNNDSLGSNFINDIAEDHQGLLWLVTEGGSGINLMDPISKRFIRYSYQQGRQGSISSNKVKSIYRDNVGDWWFGHFPSGISRVDNYSTAFENYKHYPSDSGGLIHNGILSFVEDDKKNFWIGTEGGLSYLNRQTSEFSHYLHDPKNPNSLPAPAVVSMLMDSNKNLWLGTFGGGISHLNPETGIFSHYQPATNNLNSLSDDKIWILYLDKQGVLWAGTENGGLNRFDRARKEFIRYQHDSSDVSSISHDWVHAIYEDNEGNFLVGTANGLNLMDRETGTFIRYQHQEDDTQSLSNNYIWCIFEDITGNIWLGTDGGLNRFDLETGKFKGYRAKDGLASDVVTSVLQDDQGFLWLGTAKGLSRFNSQTEKFRNYDKHHGLPGNIYNRPARLKASNGKLVFGSTNGMTIFDPQTFFENTMPPKVVFTDFQLFNKPVEIGIENSPLSKAIHQAEALTLRHEQSVFSLGFAALNYRIPELNQYAYKLEGLESEWNYAGNKRSATYTNLDAGDYTFRVKASNNDGVWNEKGASLKIIVLPPWWQTWWAYTLYGLFLLCLVFAFIHSQRKKVMYERNINAQLEDKVFERTAELGAQKHEVEDQKHELEEKNNEILATQKQLVQSEKMASLGTLTAGVAHEINNPTNFTNAAVFMMQNEIDDIKAFLNQLAGGDSADPEVLNSFDVKFEKLIELTKTAKEGAQRIKVIVDDLRTFARLDDAKQTSIKLSDLLTSTVNLVKTQYERITINTDFRDDPVITCSPSKLNQVFMNIIVNACQSIKTKQAQSHQVSLDYQGAIQISMTTKNNYLVILIKDNGCGMDKETQQKVCEPFFTTKDIGNGTGLGMAISFGIIEEHGGMIKISSIPSQGAEFSVYLPVQHNLSKEQD